MAKSAKWTGKHGTGSWFDAKNWAGGVPNASETTLFSDGGTWAISLAGNGPAQAGSMTVTGDALTFSAGTLAITAPPPKKGATNDLVIKGGGSVTLSAGATLTAGTNILLGSDSKGTSTVGTLIVAGAVATPNLFAWFGTLDVMGPSGNLATADTLTVGATLTVSAGGTVSGGGAAGATLIVGAATSGSAGVAIVDGAGSSIDIAQIVVGDGLAGSLTVQNGATVTTGNLSAGDEGDGYLLVTGMGSALTATGMTVGGLGPVSSSISVTAGGSLAIGANGLTLIEGTLALDATAQLSIGAITSLGGSIEALAEAGKQPGTVTLEQQINLGTDPYDRNLLTTVSSSGGAVLNLAGGVQTSTSAILGVTGGDVVLSNAGDNYAGTEIFIGTLAIAASGAASSGQIMFMTGGTAESVLQVDAGVNFNNVIAQFYTNNAIDLQGFAFGSGVNGSISGDVLTLNDGSSTTSLTLIDGTYTDKSFVFSEDHVGGTLIKYHG
jgi:T5SS/PEP-CTERM-associated repeat protein